MTFTVMLYDPNCTKGGQFLVFVVLPAVVFLVVHYSGAAKANKLARAKGYHGWKDAAYKLGIAAARPIHQIKPKAKKPLVDPLAYGRSRMTRCMLKTALPGLVIVVTFAQVARPAGELP